MPAAVFLLAVGKVAPIRFTDESPMRVQGRAIPDGMQRICISFAKLIEF